MLAPDEVDRLAGRCMHGQQVHAVDVARGQSFAGGFGGQADLCFAARQRGAHCIKIVFADEQHRQTPERRQIQGFMKHTFCDGTFAEKADGNAANASLHPVSQSQTDRRW